MEKDDIRVFLNQQANNLLSLMKETGSDCTVYSFPAGNIDARNEIVGRLHGINNGVSLVIPSKTATGFLMEYIPNSPEGLNDIRIIFDEILFHMS